MTQGDLFTLPATHRPTIAELVSRGALFVINHSGGKDSQAMMIRLLAIVPASQMVVIHADLGEVEWHGAKDLAERQAREAGVAFITAHAVYVDGRPKDFFNYVEHRNTLKAGKVPPFPSSKQRWCTSELKSGPINREMRRYAKQHGFSLVVNCEGLRADESDDRAKRAAFTIDEEQTVTHRTVYTWLPIHDLTTAQVFATIRDAGQEPHPAYGAGNERLSCVFCIFGSAGDIAHGAKARPDLFAKFVAMEDRLGYTMHMSRLSLIELVAKATKLAA